MTKTTPLVPRGAELTKAISKARAPGPHTFIPFKDRKTGAIGRLTPPVVPRRKMKVTLPSLPWDRGELSDIDA